ncbi:hypothetical protein EU245_03700 [Lentibacillus lipolyticus]|nr:hypothetical protein EU245_03700 [Lentibacillus lipolyticus]
MRELSIIPCGRKKIWDKYPEAGAVPAKDAYIGTFHKRCQQYAETFTDGWVVLSAKHGFLFPNNMVDGPYDVTFGQKNADIITADRLRQQVRAKQLDQYDRLIILTGQKYRPVLNSCIPGSMPREYPLMQFGGIGYILQALKRSVETDTPIHGQAGDL